MSFVESHLQSGERILYRANRGHTWYDILLAIVLTFLVAPLALALYMFAMNFLIQIIAAILPSGPEGQLVLMLLIVGLMVITPLLAVYSQIVDFIAFWQTDVVLTDRRLFGRALGRNRFWLRTIDIPTQDIACAHRYRLSALLCVDRRSTRHSEVFGPFKGLRRFVDECKRWE